MNSTVKHFGRMLAVCGALSFAFGTAQANPQSYPVKKPQFSGKVTSSINPKTGELKVCFKEIGLNYNKSVTYVAKAMVVASYACRNNGGNCPKGQETAIKENVSASATYSPDKSGTVSACITLKVPKLSKNPCPGKMDLVLQSVSWSHITLADVTNKVGPVDAHPSKQSANFGVCPAK
ncbi:hypothetical protein [Massilia scottii]|uniref:hypothetical protein n=1 Tax=Massilia scottii TaxID=3057166 RepID=UPI002796A172|nr:hypothetical protein [Massilia sp. CCM 9029]MDQ1834518.1 hypothetical protein [Massilia sp. CCM 9029]